MDYWTRCTAWAGLSKSILQVMNGWKHVTSLSSFRPTGHSIPVAVGLHTGFGMVACPPAGQASPAIQTTTGGSFAEILLYSLHDDQVTFLEIKLSE